MRAHIKQATATAVLTCLFVPAVSRLIAQSTVAGVYQTTLSAGDLPGAPPAAVERMAGDWVVMLNADGTFVVRQNGTDHVKGTYQAADRQVTFSDAAGDLACIGDGTKGVYRLDRDGTTARFVKLSDESCAGRAAVLTAKAFAIPTVTR